MFSVGVPLAIVLLLFCCLPSSKSLTCLTCIHQLTCEYPDNVDCTANTGRMTLKYLDKYRENVDLNVTSESFDCFVDKISLTSGRVEYMGCIFENVDGCSHPVRREYQEGSKVEFCGQSAIASSSWPQVIRNSAERATTSLITVLAAIALASFAAKVFGR